MDWGMQKVHIYLFKHRHKILCKIKMWEHMFMWPNNVWKVCVCTYLRHGILSIWISDCKDWEVGFSLLWAKNNTFVVLDWVLKSMDK